MIKREFNKPYIYIKGKDRKEIEAQRKLPDGILLIDINNPENNRYGCLPYTDETSVGLISLAKDKVMESLIAKPPQNPLQDKSNNV